VLPAAEVEDVLQETFLAVWRGAGAYRPSGAAGGWLWGIARRRAALLGVPPGTVKSRAHRTRRRLRAALRGGAAAEGGSR
jgi:DNA-directed RNA polymerase specialized sigma24 family protein